MIVFLIKAIAILPGTVATIYFFISGFSNKAGFKKAAISLATVFIVFTLLTIWDFASAPEVTKQKILVAKREAPVTGIELTLYDDSTFEAGNLRKITKNGNFKLQNDTLVLEIGGKRYTSFLINKSTLDEIGNAGIRQLSVELNKLDD